MANDYRIAWNLLTTQTFLNSSPAYLWQAYPLQSDQISLYVYPWSLPKDDCTTFPAYQRYTVMLDRFTYRTDGFVEFQWCFQYLTEGMVTYIESLAWSLYPFVSVTVQTRKEDGAFACYQAVALKPKPGEDFKRGYLGMEDYTIKFVGGVVAPP